MPAVAKRLLVLVAVCLVLAPLGVWGPRWVRAGAAWGEWGLEQVEARVGYRPRGMSRLAERWRAPLPDYALPARGGEGALGYVASGAVGAAATVGAAWLVARAIRRRAKPV